MPERDDKYEFKHKLQSNPKSRKKRTINQLDTDFIHDTKDSNIYQMTKSQRTHGGTKKRPKKRAKKRKMKGIKSRKRTRK